MAIAEDVAPTLLGAKPPYNLERLEEVVRALLIELGQVDKAEVMDHTPRRVAELYVQTINPPDVDVEIPFKTFDNPGMDDLVIVNDVHYVSLCEHHLAPAFGVAHVAYVPDAKVVGYSKLKKGLNYFARQPQLNERLVCQVLDVAEEQLQPKGIALVLRSVHCCIALRTNAPATELVTVTGYRGCLKDGPQRAAFDATWATQRSTFLGA